MILHWVFLHLKFDLYSSSCAILCADLPPHVASPGHGAVFVGTFQVTFLPIRHLAGRHWYNSITVWWPIECGIWSLPARQFRHRLCPLDLWFDSECCQEKQLTSLEHALLPLATGPPSSLPMLPLLPGLPLLSKHGISPLTTQEEFQLVGDWSLRSKKAVEVSGRFTRMYPYSCELCYCYWRRDIQQLFGWQGGKVWSNTKNVPPPTYSVWQKVSPKVFCHFLSNHSEFLHGISHIYYSFVIM